MTYQQVRNRAFRVMASIGMAYGATATFGYLTASVTAAHAHDDATMKAIIESDLLSAVRKGETSVINALNAAAQNGTPGNTILPLQAGNNARSVIALVVNQTGPGPDGLTFSVPEQRAFDSATGGTFSKLVNNEQQGSQLQLATGLSEGAAITFIVGSAALLSTSLRKRKPYTDDDGKPQFTQGGAVREWLTLREHRKEGLPTLRSAIEFGELG